MPDLFGLKKELECYESDYDPHKDFDSEHFEATVEYLTHSVDNLPRNMRYQESLDQEDRDSDLDVKPTKKYCQGFPLS